MGEKNPPQTIYTNILDKIDNLLLLLSKSSKDSEIDKYRRDAINKLGGIKKEITENIKSLEKNSEWNTFTIAFYGETNAGKSTLIESLRILLKEERKFEEHQLFESTRQELFQKKECIENLKLVIVSIESEIDDLKIDLSIKINELENYLDYEMNEVKLKINENDEIIEKYDVDKNEIFDELIALLIKRNELNKVIIDKMLKSTWNMIKSWFHNLDEQAELEDLNSQIEKLGNDTLNIHSIVENYENSIKELKSNLDLDIERFKNKKVEEEANFSRLENKKLKQIQKINSQINATEVQLNNLVEKLKELSDGNIIGDGRSDFTKEVGSYYFSVGDKDFAILDLPGIEGKEEIVQASIDKAVEKAHVVFYVSKKPNPPQKGDGQNLGTIEKISKQLAKHSEVYFIFNKPARNPRQLRKMLVDKEEEYSLSIVDYELQTVLGENYISHQSVSAYPAFLALGNFYDGKYFKDREKFIEKIGNINSVLELSRIPIFAEWMTSQLVNDVRKKIVKSNFKKINKTLDRAVSEIGVVQLAFENLEGILNSNFELTSSKLDDAGELYERNILNAGNKVTNELKNKVRKKIYEDIDNNIENGVFEKKFKKRIEDEVIVYSENLNKIIDQRGKEFASEVSGTVATYQRYIEELVDKYANSIKFDFDFNPQINIKMNINIRTTVFGLVGDIVGLVMMGVNTTNPVGWVILAVSALTTLFGLYKKVRAIFDEDYHKAQQKKIANENINKVIKVIHKQLDEQLSGVKDEIIKGILDIKEELHQSVNQVQTMSDTFLKAKNDINQLSIEIIHEEVRRNGDS